MADHQKKTDEFSYDPTTEYKRNIESEAKKEEANNSQELVSNAADNKNEAKSSFAEMLKKAEAFHSGFSLEEILEAEKRIGVKLPKVYRNYLKIYGKDAVNTKYNNIIPPCDIDTSYNHIDYDLADWEDEFKEAKKNNKEEKYADNEYYSLWCLPQEQWKQITDNYLLIWYENQGVWFAGYKLSDLSEGMEDPPVYITTNDDMVSFKKCCDNTEDFLKMMFEEAEAESKDLPLISMLKEMDVSDNEEASNHTIHSKKIKKIIDWLSKI